MNKSIFTLSVLALLTSAGCVSGTSGGPGAVDSTKQPVIGQADETFHLLMPETVMRQGETKTVSITIKRALNFNEDVEITFAKLPKGLSIDDSSPVIKHGDTEARITLTAKDDAGLGDFSFQVTGTPTTGSDAKNNFKVTITKK